MKTQTHNSTLTIDGEPGLKHYSSQPSKLNPAHITSPTELRAGGRYILNYMDGEGGEKTTDSFTVKRINMARGTVTVKRGGSLDERTEELPMTSLGLKPNKEGKWVPYWLTRLTKR